MQLTRVLYKGLMRSATLISFALVILTNGLLYAVLLDKYRSAVDTQQQLFSSLLTLSSAKASYSELSKVLSDSLFVAGWQITDSDKNVIEQYSYPSVIYRKAQSIETPNTSMRVTYYTFYESYLAAFIIYNIALLAFCLLAIFFTQKGLFKHWKVLIQLETWASRQSKDDNFKFFINTKDYHLVNTVRKLNFQRIQAQKGGLEIDHLIRSQAFLDALTGLGNRLYFDNRLEAVLQEEQSTSGAVLFINFASLDELRDQQGSKATSYYVKNYAELLRPYLDDTQQSIVARISYSEFAILLPYTTQKAVERIAEEILEKSQRFALPYGFDQSASCYIGIKSFDYNETVFHILAEADLALRAAQLQGPSSWFMYESMHLPAAEVKGSVRWRVALEKALKNRQFILELRPVMRFDGTVDHYETVMNMIDEDQNLIRSNIFMPMARKSGVIPEVDKLSLQLCLNELTQQEKTPVSVRIHIDSLLSRDFDVWLVRFLKKNAKVMHRIIFEISEFELTNNVKSIRQLLKIIKRYSGNIMVSQVGLYVVDLNYLNHTVVDGLKLHASVSGLIENNNENQLFIRSLVGVANTQKQTVIATGVESESQISKLRELGVKAYQRV